MSSPARKQSACFTVTGEWLAEFARARVIEGRWDHAVDTLKCLEGMSLDQIISVLKATHTLTGDSTIGVDIVEDTDAADYLAQLEYSFSGVWNNDGRFMRPYAIVTAWDTHDMVETKTKRGRWSHNSLYYADDPDRDVLTHLKYSYDCFLEADILWHEVSNFPHLIMRAASHGDPQTAVDVFTGRLEERGAHGGRSRLAQLDLIESLAEGQTADPTKLETDTHPFEPDDEPVRTDADRLKDIQTILPGYGYAKLFPDPVSDLEIVEIGNEIRAASKVSIEIDGKQVPREPFENWCLWRGDGAHLALPWEPIAPTGLKMMGDDPYHTDFILGAGLDLDAMKDHDSSFSKAVYDMRRQVQQEKLGFKVAVLCGTGTSSTLKVVHPKRDEACKPDEVAVIPNAGPHYVAAAMSAGAVICEQGGAMAHLVTVSREKDIKIVRIEDARKIYPVGMHLVVDCAAGDVRVPYNRIDHKMKIMGQIIDVDELP